MAYSELIKSFTGIREYVRQFYVYGFRSRADFDLKSARSYDNEHRRVESWLYDYMRFRKESGGKIVFISVDSRASAKNPLFKAFKTKSFTSKDIIFHFYILDLLSSYERLSIREILELFDKRYLSFFENAESFDESTIRKKLKEYVGLGILEAAKKGRDVYYSLSEGDFDIEPFSDAVQFFSEVDPLGVAGSYISDRYEKEESIFNFKHNYIFRALESEIVYTLATAIAEEKNVILSLKTEKQGYLRSSSFCPLKIYVSTQTGRQYLLCYYKEDDRFIFIRTDNITDARIDDKEADINKYREAYREFEKYRWGVSLRNGQKTDTVEMVIHIEDDERFIVNRLLREKRCGTVECVDENTYRYRAEVYDVMEMVPWIRTFIGRIVSLESSDPALKERLNADIYKLCAVYGGVVDDLQ